MEEDKNNRISDSRIGTYGTLVATPVVFVKNMLPYVQECVTVTRVGKT